MDDTELGSMKTIESSGDEGIECLAEIRRLQRGEFCAYCGRREGRGHKRGCEYQRILEGAKLGADNGGD